ncbi:unnamed protein product [Tilletia controversa]|uniref:UBC core domain-containing protein n=3 Tax=Tilletia TaxID=13289 RepID=A0A8X7MTX5_9BASI|nr:hypothetical protein CF336_g2798 [Tilletia laevis]KAE8198226.1 hypothetical protein CF328_g3613 [Tilletia controversa]KAE8256623.1 hypothetical protein A4X03_0g5221 [Tilletia caries]KAE8204045.1 hypothetical protein CF335_g2799 [Tilletia laevis]KAE8247665.1 hypothetical protein A4X06_0g4285 [Tilletia controversa]
MAGRRATKATKAPALGPLAVAEIDFQLSLLRSQCPEGVYIEPDTSNPGTWHGVVFVRSGIFQGGIFRFDIVFPPTSQRLAPQVYFPPTLLHPLLDPATGRLSLVLRFSSGWDPRTSTVLKLLLYLKSIFQPSILDATSERIAANVEVLRMYRDDRPLFLKLAHQAVALSSSEAALYERGQAASYPSYGSQSDISTGAGIHFSRKMDEAALRREIFEDEDEDRT